MKRSVFVVAFLFVFLSATPFSWSMVKHQSLYPGIDFIHHGGEGSDYETIVSPNANPWDISLGPSLIIKTAAAHMNHRGALFFARTIHDLPEKNRMIP